MANQRRNKTDCVSISNALFACASLPALSYGKEIHCCMIKGDWGNALKIRKLMKERGVQKVPGYSWIEIRKTTHMFVAADESHHRCLLFALETLLWVLRSRSASRIEPQDFILMRTVVLWVNLSYGTVQDIACLKSVKNSLKDPYGYLNSSWNFNNDTEGFICKFTGVECWNRDENKVMNLRLSDMGLEGKFPAGLANCSSMTGLDLSRNKLFGTIPDNISHIVGFLTTIDLSSNNFLGNIPRNLANITYLNSLKLDHNQLTGQIPAELVQLGRLKVFSASNNYLSGPIPMFVNVTLSVENNQGLCGRPLSPCQANSKAPHTGVIVGAVVSGMTCAAIVVGIAFDFQVSMFEESMTKMRLSDLMKATDAFSKNNIIGSGRTGTMFITHLSTFVNGEFGDLGYVAPEYARTLVATTKGDVYSFGTLLLELVTGEKPTHVSKAPESFKGSLVEWVTQLSRSDQLQHAIDKSLLGKGVDNELFQFIKVACNCVLPAPEERPTMFEVYQFLRAIGERYQFTVEDEILRPSDSEDGDADCIEEHIVA
ncbi:hypothetical protein Q3G72_016104 [Acer saccharum]|nr:hypothetical protein Q3G72_016104 [Acer saccharum]